MRAQSGTYEKRNTNGSYCYISLQKDKDTVKAEIFAWWNTAGAQTGSYYGEGLLANNSCILKSDENEPDCEVTLALLPNKKLSATYNNCAADNVTEDFNGEYTKITDATAGEYLVTAAKTYFYKKPGAIPKLKSYLVKGDKVTLNLDMIVAGKWVNVYYTNTKGKETAGYLPLSDLKKLK